MRIKLTGAGAFVLGVALCLTAPRASAVITRLTSLGDVLKEQQYICVAKVEKLDRHKPMTVLTVAEDLKGKLPFRRLPVNLRGDNEAQKHDDVAQLLKRLAPDLPVVLCANQRGKRLTVFGYSNGTWFQLIGQQLKEDTAILGFTHCEPYLRRTFKGTTADLRQALVDGLAGKRPPPPANPNEPPGLGPEIRSTKDTKQHEERPTRSSSCSFVSFVDRISAFGFRPSASGGPLFAVIPSLGVGAPLAVLALLFPSLFGGVTLLFRRWTAFFTVFSIVSMAYMVHGWFAKSLRGTWLGTTGALWLVMTLVTLAGLLWAWRRQTDWLEEGPAAAEPPRRTENLVLGILSLSCLLAVFLYWLNLGPGTDPTWNFLLVISAGIWAGLAYKLYRSALYSQAPARSALPTEGVMLWTCLLGFVFFALPSTGPAALAEEPTFVSSDLANEHGTAKFVKAEGTALTAKGGGIIVSSPRIVGERVYASVAHKAGLETFGAVYCLDRKTRKILWVQDDEGGMKQMFSSPCVAAGRLYVGEGFHDDRDCKLYCLDAGTGKKLWEFQTSSQTESSPCAVGGRVFFGAGNDGVFALDAQTGKKLWQFQSTEGKLLRVGASPVVAGGRLYVGSGVDRNSPDDPGETAVFCLDAATGKLLWKVPVSLPVWGAPAVAGDRVYFGLGNGDIFTEAKEPQGALLCLDARDGAKVWETKLPGGVLERPVLDLANVYFGCRDKHCYCLDRATGKERWKKDLGSPVISSPALAFDPSDGHSTAVFVASSTGRVSCLDPATGQAHWTYADLEKAGNTHVSSSLRVVVHQGDNGEHRSVYFGVALDSLSTPVLYRLEDVLSERASP